MPQQRSRAPSFPRRSVSFHRKFPYHLIWAAREGELPAPEDSERHSRIAAALEAEIDRLRERSEDGKPTVQITRLANALAGIDGRGSAATVLEAISVPVQWQEYTCVDAAERLLMAGVPLPAAVAFALVDAVLERGGTMDGRPKETPVVSSPVTVSFR